MNTFKNFKSIDNKHQVDTNIIEDIAWFNINELDFESFKTFLLLLKDILTYFKNNNVKYIKQYVLENDIVYFKKSSITNINDNMYSITTNIEDFVDELVNVLNIKII